MAEKEYIERGANCVDCIHAEVCLSQYGSQVKRWALTDGCKRYKSTADVVEVVRCKDCKYCFAGKCECPQWEDAYYARFIRENDFCSYGAKMDGKDGDEE